MAYLNGPSFLLGEGTLYEMISLYWFNLTDSQEAVITIHNLNRNQSGFPELIWPQGGDRGASAQDEQA